MANPTTAPPTTPEWDSTANANLQFFAPLTETTGGPRDIVGNKVGKQYCGYGNMSSGPWPTCPGDTVSGTAFNSYRFQWGDRAIRWYRIGWASGTSVPNRTIALVFRVRAQQATNIYSMGTLQQQIFGCTDSQSNFSLAIQISTDGVITLGHVRGGAGLFGSFSRTLTADTWYAVALTLTSATGRLLNVYDYTAQAADSQASSTDSLSVTIGSANNSFCLNNGHSTHSGLIEVACALAANETWDSGSNTRFADFYTDPWVWARGSYTSAGGTLTAGHAEFAYGDTDGVTLTCTRPTQGVNGTAGTAYTYQWYYHDTNPAFSPPTTGTLISGATSRVLTDTSIPADTNRYYKCVQSDGTSSVTTVVCPARKPRGSLRIGLIGDSRQAGNPGDQAQVMIGGARNFGWNLSVSNRGLSGSFLAPSTSSADKSWWPGQFCLIAATATAGTYTLTWQGQTTSALAYNANAATVQAAIEALSTVGSGNATVSGTLTGSSGMSVLLSGAALPSPVGSTALTVNTGSFTGTSLRCYSLYGSAVAQFTGSGVTAVSYSLGANDISRDRATMEAYLTTFCADLVASGFTVYIQGVAGRGDSYADSNQLNNYGFASLGASVANGTTIFDCGQALYDRGCADSGGTLADGIHDTSGGYYGVGYAHWEGIVRNLDPTAYGSSSGTPPRWVPRRRR